VAFSGAHTWTGRLDFFLRFANSGVPTVKTYSSPTEGDFSDENHFEPLRDTLQQLDLIHRLVDLYRDDLELVDKADDVMRIFKEGRCASLIGVEGLHQIGNSASALRMFHRLGVRYVTLAHNRNNLYADSAVCTEVLRKPHGIWKLTR
jgi:membrane dipeptidase